MLLTLLYIATGLAFLAVVLTLVMGAIAMGKKSEDSRKASNKWMWRRIYAQITAGKPKAARVVKLNKIYTRTGDDGSTGLVDGSRLSKAAGRVCAYGDVDELNSILRPIVNMRCASLRVRQHGLSKSWTG